MKNHTIFYRPEWTCGRYNNDNNLALMYNLIDGKSYLFGNDSAEVIKCILSVDRNNSVFIKEISSCTQIDIESLFPFFEELASIGLLSKIPCDRTVIDNYRKEISSKNKKNLNTTNNALNEVDADLGGAEKEYCDRTGTPTCIMLELTYNCSEKCIHCYNPGATRNDSEIDTRAKRVELELDDYKKIIDELTDLGVTRVCLSGGDPFSKKIVWDIIDYLYKKEIATDLFTNGQVLVNNVERLANYYPYVVGVSLYSGIPEEHDYITRINGSWERTMAVIQQLSNYGVPMNLKCCIMRSNVRNYHTIKEIAKKYGAIPQFSVSLIDSLEGDHCVSKYLQLPKEVLKIILMDKDIPSSVNKLHLAEEEFEKPPVCSSYCITPEGNVQLCNIFPSPIGNVKDQSLIDILKSSKELKWWKGITIDDYEICGQYEYCKFCKPCPGVNFIQTGSPLKPAETNCDIAKIRYDLSRMLQQGIDPLEGKTVQENLNSMPIAMFSVIKQEFDENYRNNKMSVL